MILLTIGTQLPFDRLVKALDELAPSLNEPIVGQIGTHAQYLPQNFQYFLTMRPTEFDLQFRSARVIVSHAGIGTILSARKHGKPIVIVPRQAKFGEHRNDHQLATCAQMSGKVGIYVAPEPDALLTILQQSELSAAAGLAESPDRIRLMDGLRTFARGITTARRA